MQWEIVRTYPVGKTRGLAIPAFIHNGDYYYAPIHVYGDGLVDCWGSVDLEIFRRKVDQGWVVVGAPVGSRIDFHNLGSASVHACSWQFTTKDLLKRVEKVIELLNPKRIGLVNMNGEECEMRGKVRYSKFGLTNGKPYRIAPDGSEVLADFIPVLLRKGLEFHLTSWFVFADGQSRVGTSEKYSTLEEIAERFNGGDLYTSAPSGARLTIEGLGWFEARESYWYVKPDERIREARDVLATLRGAHSAVRTCLNCFREYEANPSSDNRDRLQLAYEAVPEHLRLYCGTMDSKDWPIRRVLYGDEIDTEVE